MQQGNLSRLGTSQEHAGRWKTNARMAAASSLLLLVVACGTSSPQGLGAPSKDKLQGQTLVVANTSKQADFRSFTPGKAAFSLLGDVAMVSEGNRIATQNGLADPSVAIARELAQEFNAAAGTRWNPSSVALAADSRSAAVESAKAAGADVVLYVRTHDWRTWYYTTNFNRYRARVEVSAELVHVGTQTVLAQATCDESSPQSPEGSPTYNEMVGAGAQRLKEEVARAQSACVLALKKGLLGS